MIHSIRCDKPSFRRIDFQPGFNVILAERTKEATMKDSRNGLGKSTLIEIIHFCFGANKGETLKKENLEGWSFTLEVDLAGKKYFITRNTAEQNAIIVEGDCSGWAIQPKVDKKTGNQVFSSRDWNSVLGTLMFGLNASYGDLKYNPTFRSMISYLIRRNGQSGAFLSPFQQYKNQLEWNIQVNNSYLLGLGWEYASRWQVLKDRNKVLAQIKQEAQSGLLAGMIGSLGELEALKIRLEAKVRQEELQLKTFKVHPQYSSLEQEANDITNQIHALVNANMNDKRLLEHYEQSLSGEVEANADTVKKTYEEAGIVLHDSVKKRLDDVLNFHKQVVVNRKEFLKTEMDRLKSNIAKREQQKHELSDKRADLLSVLQEHGALEEYTRLQGNHQKTIAEIKDLELRIDNLKKFEQGKSSITVEQELLQQEATSDLGERKSQKEKAVLLFNENSQALYDAPGTLSIDVSKTGFKFGVNIERSGSHGIGNMKIFCYDLMLAQIWAEKDKSPGILIHDSILFADVDERQKALALQLVAKEAERLGFQYICTMNSDTIPRNDFNEDFKFDTYVRMTFTDASDDGGLLGTRF